MRLIKKSSAISRLANTLKENSQRIGLVPTMGALHKGHLSLVKKALEENSSVIVSIFVNPTQFNKAEDLKTYPRTLDADLKKLETLKKSDAIVVFVPEAEDLYNGEVVAKNYEFDGLELQMEGTHRSGHFNGVGTVVSKIFEITRPNNAYFGEKDYQQLLVIKKLVEITKSAINIVGCPIYRQANGLALSSRNQRLTDNEKQQAGFIFQILKRVEKKFETESISQISDWITQQFKAHPLLVLEYFEIADANTLQPLIKKDNGIPCRAFIAVYVNKVRLIDNIALN